MTIVTIKERIKMIDGVTKRCSLLLFSIVVGSAPALHKRFRLKV